jgi:predicted transcriptional regulator
MSSAVTISATASVAEAMQIMRRHDIRRLPVVEDGQPVGIVSLGDLSASSEAGQLLADISLASQLGTSCDRFPETDDAHLRGGEAGVIPVTRLRSYPLRAAGNTR